MRDEHRHRPAHVRVRRHQGAAAHVRPDRRAPPRASRTLDCSSGMRRRRYSRRSTETCSFRDGPCASGVPPRQCARPADARQSCEHPRPAPFTHAGSRRPCSRIPARPSLMLWPSSAVSAPQATSASAHARLPVTSSSNSRRSNGNETPKSNASGSGAESKRPDQRCCVTVRARPPSKRRCTGRSRCATRTCPSPEPSSS